MTDKEKFQPNLITFKGARLAFARIHKAEARKGKDGQPKGEPKFSCTVLLDPSNKEHQATINQIVSESVRALNHRYGEGRFNAELLLAVARGEKSFPNFHLAWGFGNALPAFGKKVYDGFKDMFFLKLADKSRPNLLNRDGKPVVEGDPQCPYAGAYVAGTTTIYSYDNESRGANANLRTLVFQRDGQAFGGGGANAEQEFAAIGDLGDAGAAADPFGGAGGGSVKGGSAPAADPFAIS